MKDILPILFSSLCTLCPSLAAEPLRLTTFDVDATPSLGTAMAYYGYGELFVEYQLAAKAMRPELHVMMAAYGNHGPGYISTAAAYPKAATRLTPPPPTSHTRWKRC
jgi:hypothetical protein